VSRRAVQDGSAGARSAVATRSDPGLPEADAACDDPGGDAVIAERQYQQIGAPSHRPARWPRGAWYSAPANNPRTRRHRPMLDHPTASFGDLLRHYRQAAGLTQEGLAERAGLSVHGIQKLERGVTHPYRDTARRLAEVLKLSPDDEEQFRAAVQPVRRHGTRRGGAESAHLHHNLPMQLSSFIGRDRELADVIARLEDARLLTLRGVGGCGKTRLALEVARSIVAKYPDGLRLVELGPLSDPALVAQQVGAALDVRESPEQPFTTALIRSLAGRRVLLVLDNCEHLLQSCALLLNALLRGCPDLHVLATSREPIGIDGEVAWPVPSLAVPNTEHAGSIGELANNPSAQLFVERARAAQPRFTLSVRNASAVAQICQRLDGIPLALELAAARIQALTAEQLALRLDQRFRLLTGGSRAALPRQQTLQATLDWSYELPTRSEPASVASASVSKWLAPPWWPPPSDNLGLWPVGRRNTSGLRRTCARVSTRHPMTTRSLLHAACRISGEWPTSSTITSWPAHCCVRRSR
jgi:transcriptional regulator with XRE-family HTH domain